MTNSGADFDLHWPPGPANRVKSLLSNYNWICIYSRRLFVGALIVIEFVFVFVVGAYLQVPNQASGIQRQLIKVKGGRVARKSAPTYFHQPAPDTLLKYFTSAVFKNNYLPTFKIGQSFIKWYLVKSIWWMSRKSDWGKIIRLQQRSPWSKANRRLIDVK